MSIPALPRLYAPKHAAPREPLSVETRSVLAVGLAAAVLPFGAAPALADSDTGTGSSAATGTASTSASPEPTPAAPAPQASPYEVGPSATPSPAQSSTSRTAQRKASTSLSFTAPSSARTNAVPVGVRLLANGKAVRNGYVRLEKSTSNGWTYVGRLLTSGDGTGRGTVRVTGGAKLRAAYTGSQVRSAAVSRARTVRAAAAEDRSSVLLQEAAKLVGKPYRYGAVGPDAFDCSGFTLYVFAKVGINLPHNSRAQEDVATPVAKADARPGDLIFMQNVPGHVGIYAGNGKMYDAPRSGKTVSLRAIWSPDYTVGRV